MKLENKRERKIKEENVPNLQEHHFHLEKRAQTKDQSEGRMGVSEAYLELFQTRLTNKNRKTDIFRIKTVLQITFTMCYCFQLLSQVQHLATP